MNVMLNETPMPLPELEETSAQIRVRFLDAEQAPFYGIEDETPDGEIKNKPKLPPRRPQPKDGATEVDDVKARYESMKKQLDENFKVMFELKRELDAAQNRMSSKWEEYYALQQQYNKQLQKIVAAWVTDTLY